MSKNCVLRSAPPTWGRSQDTLRSEQVIKRWFDMGVPQATERILSPRYSMNFEPIISGEVHVARSTFEQVFSPFQTKSCVHTRYLLTRPQDPKTLGWFYPIIVLPMISPIIGSFTLQFPCLSWMNSPLRMNSPSAFHPPKSYEELSELVQRSPAGRSRKGHGIGYQVLDGSYTKNSLNLWSKRNDPIPIGKLGRSERYLRPISNNVYWYIVILG